MSEAKGPKVAVPEELLEELEAPEQTDEGGNDADPVELSGAESEAGADPGGNGADPETGGEGGEGGDAEAELAALKERYLRLAADLDNFKRRSLKERQDLHNYATEGLIKDLLPTLDNLERAVGHGQQEEVDAKSLHEGVELTYRSLMQVLERSGLLPVEPDGEPFNPEYHEAIRQVPSDEHPTGTVIEVLQKGYLMRDRLLRAALVAVSAGPGPSGGEASGSDAADADNAGGDTPAE